MANGGSASHWQRLVVDILIVTSTTAIALAAAGAAPGVMILIAAALIGVGLVLDPTEPAAAQQAREHFDAALADASSL
jgi:hypothetical protein